VLRGGERAQRRLVELPDGVLGQLVEHLDEYPAAPTEAF
jgi:hypothetical protein